MKREEAIEKLRSQRDGICNGCLHAVGWCENHCGFSEVIDMAIEALRQPEIVRCKDCANRNTPRCSMEWDDICWAEDDDYCSDADRRILNEMGTTT